MGQRMQSGGIVLRPCKARKSFCLCRSRPTPRRATLRRSFSACWSKRVFGTKQSDVPVLIASGKSWKREPMPSALTRSFSAARRSRLIGPRLGPWRRADLAHYSLVNRRTAQTSEACERCPSDYARSDGRLNRSERHWKEHAVSLDDALLRPDVWAVEARPG